MDMSGERRIPAPRQKVWDGLNDPAVLKACIPGCESLEKVSDTEMKATAAVKIGPINARFNGRVQLSELDPPHAYTISGEGQGGVAGFAKGGAHVHLDEEPNFTVMRYDVNAQVGGKIAQLGARLIDATAKSMADAFFDRFVAEVAGAPAEEAGAVGIPAVIATTTPAGPADAAAIAASGAPRRAAPAPVSMFALIPAEPLGLPRAAWIGGAICLAIFLLIFSAYF
jgi:carbon monoxide dehydrogenase subunit G